MQLRDKALDQMRALLAIYTIWGHVFAWNGLFLDDSSPINLKIWMISPMVFFFFLIGMSNSIGRKRPFKEYFASRVLRVYLPYLLYVILAVLICVVFCAVKYEGYFSVVYDYMKSRGGVFAENLTVFTPGSPFYWLIPLDYTYIPVPQELAFLTSHLWFFPVYIITIMLFPFLRFCYDKLKKHKWIPIAVLLALAVVLRFFKVLFWRNENPLGSTIGSVVIGLPMNIVCYTLFMYLGLFYKHIRRPTRKIKILAIASSAVGFILLIGFLKLPWLADRLRISLPIFWQEFIYAEFGFIKNELPANLIYILEYFALFPIIYLLSPYVLKAVSFLRRKIKPVNWLFGLYENNYFVIFVFSPVSFLLGRMVLQAFGVFDGLLQHEVLAAAVLSVILLPMCGLAGKLLAPIDRLRMGRRGNR